MPDEQFLYEPADNRPHSQLRRLLTGSALLLLGFGLGLPLLISSLSLEFIRPGDESTFYVAVGGGLAVAPLLLLIGWLIGTDSWLAALLKLAGGGLLYVVLFYGTAVAALSGMCVWTTEATLFVHRTDPDRTIARRSIGCGATDSGPPGHGTFQLTRWPLGLQRVVRVDVSRLDPGQWQPAR